MADNRWAVVVGCNYRGTKNELRGCINDAVAMRDLLTELSGFKPSHIMLLTDYTQIKPTGANIKQALHEMFDNAKPGDRLFFHFSGHGTREPDIPGGEEAIVCLDENLITKYDFRELVNRLPRGASFHMVSDSCHSGGLIDKETEQIGPSRSWTTSRTGTLPHNARPRTIPFRSIVERLGARTGNRTSDVNALMRQAFGGNASLRFRLSAHELTLYRHLEPNQGILISGCQSNELASDTYIVDVRKHHGVFTYALIQAVRSKELSDYWCSNRRVVTSVRKVLEDMGYHNQHPCLYSSDANADAGFAATIERECWKWDPNNKTR